MRAGVLEHLLSTHLPPFKQHWSRWQSPPTGFCASHLPLWHRVEVQSASAEQVAPSGEPLEGAEDGVEVEEGDAAVLDAVDVEAVDVIEAEERPGAGAAHLPETHLPPFKQHWSRWHSPPTGF